MQIVLKDGRPCVRSCRAPELSRETFGRLREKTVVSARDGKELQLYPLRNGYLIWQRDVSQLRGVIEQLRRSAGELEQESVLLRQELKLQSEETAVREQNRIYNRLTEEVGGQLSLLRGLLQKADTAADKAVLFRQICLIGTYVKRRCNLRLIEQSEGSISPEDLELSFRDLLSCLAEMGADTDLTRLESAAPPPALALLSLDIFEFLLEYERFAPAAVRVRLAAEFTVDIRSGARSGVPPAAELARMERDGCRLACAVLPGGYRVTLRGEEETPC